MTATARAVEPELLPGDIVGVVEHDATPFILDEEKWQEFLARVREETSAAGTDVSTEEARDTIRSAAYNISRCKSKIDAAGKALTEEARKQVNEVNAARKRIKETLDEIRDQVRAPLTQWEDAEKAREERINETRDELRWIILNGVQERTSQAAKDLLERTEARVLRPELYQDKLELANSWKADAIERLRKDLAEIEKAEAEHAELEQLRAEKAEREAKEREAEAARQRAEEQALAEKRRADAKAREAEEAKRREEEAAERARQEERERIAREKAEEEAAAEHRAANKRRQNKVRSDLRTALLKVKSADGEPDLDADQADRIIDAIFCGEIPHIELRF